MEPRKRKTLLDLDRLPTQKELREFFLANDWSARKPYDFDEWSQEKIEDKSYSENIFNKIWHKISYWTFTKIFYESIDCRSYCIIFYK